MATDARSSNVVDVPADKPVLSVAEYRKLLQDNVSSDERIQERIDFLVRFTRKNIKLELQKLCQK